jgi:tRNA A-37 threonylcarbamoyl transferase component Bud32
MTKLELCPHCGGELPADAPEGLCPECLFRRSVEGHGAGPDPSGDTGPYGRGFVQPAPPALAAHFPQLEILELVGKGGMGAVYRARQPALDRTVAVKVLPPEVARDPTFAERFCREARSLARFNHPNIVTVYDFGEAGGFCYIVMEFAAGRNLRQMLRAGALSEDQVLRVVAQVCDALQYAHDLGVVHRDIKPENILLDAHGRVKIADFGLAKLADLAPSRLSLTGSREVMGTVYYMAPEQLLRNVEVDHRADVYSLGVVFYEMLTGELPVGRFAPPGQRARVDARLDAIVLRALESKVEDRYQDAAEFKRDVEAVLAGPHNPVAGRASWPCVRFTIPLISWLGAHAKGEMYRDETTLILDFSVVNALGHPSPKEVRIPLADLRMLALQDGTRANLPHLLKPLVPARPELVIKVSNPASLAGLPAGPHGRGRLRIHAGDAAAAQQLVDGILGSPLPAVGVPRPNEQIASPEGVRRDIASVAMTFLLTVPASVVATGLALVFLRARGVEQIDHVDIRLIVALLAIVVPAGTGLLLAGAVQALRLRGYRLCLAAALVAALPWSPAWPLGLAVAIRAVLVLGRRDVMLAFLGESDGAAPEPPPNPRPLGRVADKIRAMVDSFVGYFVTTSGTRPGSPRGTTADEP